MATISLISGWYDTAAASSELTSNILQLFSRSQATVPPEPESRAFLGSYGRRETKEIGKSKESNVELNKRPSFIATRVVEEV